MGYNVLETGSGTGTIEGFYALFGCLQPLGSPLLCLSIDQFCSQECSYAAFLRIAAIAAYSAAGELKPEDQVWDASLWRLTRTAP